MLKNLVYILAVLITTIAVSGGVIMAQQYQANNSSTVPVLETPTCPCGGGCNCTANGQPCSCGQNGTTCRCGDSGINPGSGQCHKKTVAPQAKTKIL